MKGAVVIMKFGEFIKQNFVLQVRHKVDVGWCVFNVKLHDGLITFDMNIFRYIYDTDPRLAGHVGTIRATIAYDPDRFMIDEESGRAIIDAENDLEWLKQAELVDVKILRKN